MQPSLQLALMTEVDDAVRLSASDRVLRLLIQNLPKLPERAAYRLFLAHYFLRRNRPADAIRVARFCVDRGLSSGDMVLAVGGLRLLAAAGETADADAVLSLSDLPRLPVGSGAVEAEGLDLTADRPRLPQDLLISVAVEMASGGLLTSEPAAGLGHVPVLTDMPPSSLRWTLENLELATFEKGESLFGSGAHCALWWIWGGIQGADGGAAPAPGTFVTGDGRADGLLASSFCMALSLPAHFSDMWNFLPGVEDALVAATVRSNARFALSGALGALRQEDDDGFALVGTALLSRDEVVAQIPPTVEAVVALAGLVSVVSADGQRFVLRPGDAGALPLGATEIRGMEPETRVALFRRARTTSGRALTSPTQAARSVGLLPVRGATRPAGSTTVPD